jgi:hypothetical protein
MATNHRAKPNDKRQPRRRVHADGVIEEWGPMGRTLTIPSSPRRDLDPSAEAAGWEPMLTFLRRLHRRW